jgi:hypothetical protein
MGDQNVGRYCSSRDRLVGGLQPMTSRAAENLGNRLERERVRRFVGRAAELELFTSWLQASSNHGIPRDRQESFGVLWVYGPGGIGKSTLLQAFAESVRNAGTCLLRSTAVGSCRLLTALGPLSGRRWPRASTLLSSEPLGACRPGRA